MGPKEKSHIVQTALYALKVDIQTNMYMTHERNINISIMFIAWPVASCRQPNGEHTFDFSGVIPLPNRLESVP